MEICKAHDLQILNGRTNGDIEGNFTFYDYNKGASTIDLAVVSDATLNQVKSFNVHPQDHYSQHCKIVLRLNNIKSTINIVKEKDNHPWIPLNKRYIWAPESSSEFEKAITSQELTNTAIECGQYLDAGLVELASNKIDEIFNSAAELALDSHQLSEKNKIAHPYKHKKKRKKWFDTDCRTQKDITRKLAISKHRDPQNEDIRAKHKEALKKYKNICREKKAIFEQRQMDKLDQLMNDPTLFWKEWKHIGEEITKTNIPDGVNGERWENYFKELYNNNTEDKYPVHQQTTRKHHLYEQLTKSYKQHTCPT